VRSKQKYTNKANNAFFATSGDTFWTQLPIYIFLTCSKEVVLGKFADQA